MTPPTPEWLALFDWLRDETLEISRPKCPRHLLSKWCGNRSQEELEQTEAAMLQWLETWSWPEMTDDVRGLVWVRMSFAWSMLVTGMDRGWVLPDSEYRRRGVLRGLIFGQWYEMGEPWLMHFQICVEIGGLDWFPN